MSGKAKRHLTQTNRPFGARKQDDMSTMTTKTVKAGFLREGDVMVTDASDLFGKDSDEMHVWFDVVTRTEEQGWEGNSIFLIHVEGGSAVTTKQHHEVQVLGNTEFSDTMKDSLKPTN